MSFAQTEYLLFLPLVVAVFQFVPARARVAALLAASWAFPLWQRPLHLAVLVGSTVLDYGVGLALGRATATSARRLWLAASVLGNLSLLGFFKYGGLLGWQAPLLPLGISFYTFQTLSYSIDVYRRRAEPCRSFPRFALYVAFFPQLVAGPIERASHLLPQLEGTQPLTLANASAGGRLVLWGLLKKLVLADRFRAPLLGIIAAPQQHDAVTLLVAGLCLNVVLYLDFSAYTDLARGSARLFGVSLVRNFRAPYLARSMSDFTRRWHVSLVEWIGDYLYAPLMRGRLTHARLWGANLLVMGVFGLWHGARWDYLGLGMVLGAAISTEASVRLAGARAGRRRAADSAWRAVAGWAATLALWSLFTVGLFSPDTGASLAFLRGLAALRTPDAAALPWIGTALGLLALGLAVHAAGERLDLERLWRRIGPIGRVSFVALAVFLLVRHRALEPEAFVYFRF